jgi:2-aminoadipate transaminase
MSISQRARAAGGQPIGPLMKRALENPGLISLAAGFVDQATLPVNVVRTASEALLREQDIARAALQYGSTAGHPELRRAVVERLAQQDRNALDADAHQRVIVTSGSNQLLHLIGEALLDPGDVVITSAPSYLVFMGLMQGFGAMVEGVACDAHGLIPEALEELLRKHQAAGTLSRVKALYVMSYFDNPSSRNLAGERRARIVEIAQRYSTSHTLYVIEDTAYRDLRYAGEDLPSLRSFDAHGTHVIYTSSFSKAFSPGIRVGWGLFPTSLVAPLLDIKGNIDFGSPNFSQALVAKVMELGLFEPHVRALRGAYHEKLKVALAVADRCLGPIEGVSWERPSGGMYLWLQLPSHVDAGMNGALFDRAVQEGVLYIPGEHCFAGDAATRPRNHIRLSYGSQQGPAIGRGIEALARAIRSVV